MEAKFNEKFNSKMVADKVNLKNLNYQETSVTNFQSTNRNSGNNMMEKEKHTANDNVMDIMFQMMYDERRFGLDKK